MLKLATFMVVIGLFTLGCENKGGGENPPPSDQGNEPPPGEEPPAPYPGDINDIGDEEDNNNSSENDPDGNGEGESNSGAVNPGFLALSIDPAASSFNSSLPSSLTASDKSLKYNNGISPGGTLAIAVPTEVYEESLPDAMLTSSLGLLANDNECDLAEVDFSHFDGAETGNNFIIPGKTGPNQYFEYDYVLGEKVLGPFFECGGRDALWSMVDSTDNAVAAIKDGIANNTFRCLSQDHSTLSVNVTGHTDNYNPDLELKVACVSQQGIKNEGTDNEYNATEAYGKDATHTYYHYNRSDAGQEPVNSYFKIADDGSGFELFQASGTLVHNNHKMVRVKTSTENLGEENEVRHLEVTLAQANGTSSANNGMPCGVHMKSDGEHLFARIHVNYGTDPVNDTCSKTQSFDVCLKAVDFTLPNSAESSNPQHASHFTFCENIDVDNFELDTLHYDEFTNMPTSVFTVGKDHRTVIEGLISTRVQDPMYVLKTNFFNVGDDGFSELTKNYNYVDGRLSDFAASMEDNPKKCAYQIPTDVFFNDPLDLDMRLRLQCQNSLFSYGNINSTIYFADGTDPSQASLILGSYDPSGYKDIWVISTEDTTPENVTAGAWGDIQGEGGGAGTNNPQVKMMRLRTDEATGVVEFTAMGGAGERLGCGGHVMTNGTFLYIEAKLGYYDCANTYFDKACYEFVEDGSAVIHPLTKCNEEGMATFTMPSLNRDFATPEQIVKIRYSKLPESIMEENIYLTAEDPLPITSWVDPETIPSFDNAGAAETEEGAGNVTPPESDAEVGDAVASEESQTGAIDIIPSTQYAERIPKASASMKAASTNCRHSGGTGDTEAQSGIYEMNLGDVLDPDELTALNAAIAAGDPFVGFNFTFGHRTVSGGTYSYNLSVTASLLKDGTEVRAKTIEALTEPSAFVIDQLFVDEVIDNTYTLKVSFAGEAATQCPNGESGDQAYVRLGISDLRLRY